MDGDAVRRRARRIQRLFEAACPREWKFSVSWPDESRIICRVLRDGRLRYQEFVVDDDVDDAIARWLGIPTPQPLGMGGLFAEEPDE